MAVIISPAAVCALLLLIVAAAGRSMLAMPETDHQNNLLWSPNNEADGAGDSGVTMWEVGNGLAANHGFKSNYSRSSEVSSICNDAAVGGRYIDPLPEEEAGDPRVIIEHELSFLNGDWKQSQGNSPLMPFISKGRSKELDLEEKAAWISSFWITDVTVKKADVRKGSLKVSGVLQLAILQGYGGTSLMGLTSGQGFRSHPGFSLLSIFMEGIFSQTEDQRTICMLGCTSLPVRSSNTSIHWQGLDGSLSSSHQCNLLLQIHYPKTMTLRSRAIRGVLRSLAEPGESTYFDQIKLSSQLGPYAVYHFTCGSFVDQTCRDLSSFAPVDREEVYRGTAFCSIFSQLVHEDALQIHDGRVGTRLLVQDVRCIDFQASDGERFANVSAILRKVTMGEDLSLAMQRTGAGDHAIVVDGTWRSSAGILCMAGCQNPTSDTVDSEECFAKVDITIPVSISLHQQTLLLLNISDMRHRPRSSFPGLYFLPINSDNEVHPDLLEKLHYEYGKMSEAEAMIRKEATGLSLTSKLGPEFLVYPSMKLDYHTLSRALSVYSSIIWIKSNQRELSSRGYVSFQPIAINDFICIGSSHTEGTLGDKDHSIHGKQAQPSEWTNAHKDTNTSYIKEHRDLGRLRKGDSMVKVAARLMIAKGGDITPMDTISAEGVYNPKTGSMHLVGCRIKGGEDVDCSVQIVVRYPAMNVRWLINPSVNFYIRDSRDKQETQLTVAAFSFYEDMAVKQIISERSMQGILIMTSLTLTVVCISSQLMQTRRKNSSLPFVSQLMLVVQATGYMISVMTGAEGVLSRMLHERSDQRSSQFAMEAEMEGEWTGFISYTVKILNLVTFMLVIFLYQSVRKARIAMANNRLHDHQKPPQERRVIAIFALVHAIGFLIMLADEYIFHQNDGSTLKTAGWQAGWEAGGKADDSFWFKQMSNYAVVVQDLFLLPQVIAGFIWDMEGKPLKDLYYLGLTILRLLPHAYYLLRSSVLSSQISYLSDEGSLNNSRMELDHSQISGDILIAVLALLLVVTVFFQQTSVGRRWRKAVRSSSSKLLRFGSRMYERLPSTAFEAELMPAMAIQDPPIIDENSSSDHIHDHVRA